MSVKSSLSCDLDERFEEELVDHLFNCSEKRLARTLLLLGRYGKEGTSSEGWDWSSATAASR